MIQAEKAGAATIEKVSGADAAKVICSSSHEDVKALRFDTAEAKRLGLKLGDIVSVLPSDTGT